MSFLDLPNEIILLISRELSPCELNSLLRVSRFLAALLTPALLDSVFLGRLSGYGRKALYSAAKQRDRAKVQHLLGRGILDFVGNGALLHSAVITESADAIATLLQCGIDPAVQNLQGQTALFFAALHGKVENVRILLDDGGVDVNSKDTEGCTALRGAVSGGQGTVVRLLLDRGANIGSGPRHAPLLALAVKSRSQLVIRLLLNDPRVEINELSPTRQTPLHTAASLGDPILSKILLEEGKADISIRDFQDNTPLHVACLSRAPAVVALLLGDPRVNINAPNIQGLTPLHHAIRGRDEETTRLLLSDERIDLTPTHRRRPRSYIHSAIRSGSQKTVQMLLSHGVDPSLKEPLSSLSTLSLAILRKETQIFCDLLADCRINVNQQNRMGDTPLHQVVSLGCKTMLTYLVQEPRVHINRFNAADKTALHIASKNGASQLVEILLGHAAIDVNLSGPSGKTPLHMAVSEGHAMTVRALLKHPLIDRFCKDNESRTPLGIARKLGIGEIIRMLEPCMCSPRPKGYLFQYDAPVCSFCAPYPGENPWELAVTRWSSPAVDIAPQSPQPQLQAGSTPSGGPYLMDFFSSDVPLRWPSPEPSNDGTLWGERPLPDQTPGSRL